VLFAAVQWSRLAHSVIRGAAPFLVAIGGIADIDRPQVLGRLVANDPIQTFGLVQNNRLVNIADRLFKPHAKHRGKNLFGFVVSKIIVL